MTSISHWPPLLIHDIRIKLIYTQVNPIIKNKRKRIDLINKLFIMALIAHAHQHPTPPQKEKEKKKTIPQLQKQQKSMDREVSFCRLGMWDEAATICRRKFGERNGHSWGQISIHPCHQNQPSICSRKNVMN